GAWGLKKVIEIPAEPADPDKLPAILKDFKAVPPLVTDINLSLDDKFLYVSCWGTGEFLQYDVSDPFNPKKTGSVRIGGIVNRTSHPKNPDRSLAGGPQMVEVSRDGKRIYFTNSLYAAWDEQFYPDRIGTRAFHWNYHRGSPRRADQPAPFRPEIRRCCDSVCLWTVSSVSVASPQLGRHASGFWRFNRMVFHHGIGARRRIDAHPFISQIRRRAA